MLQGDALWVEKCETTYQRLVNKMFADLIGKTMEVFVDDMPIKSLKIEDRIHHLNKAFQILQRIECV